MIVKFNKIKKTAPKKHVKACMIVKFNKIKKTAPKKHVKAFFTTACLSPNIIIQISRMRILTFSQVYIPQVVNRCHISLSFVQGLFVSFKSFILLTKMKQILFVC